MSRRLFLMVLSLAAALAFFSMHPLTAHADELCPVSTMAFRAHDALTVHAFRITSKKKLQTATDLAIETDGGWFRVAIPGAGFWDVHFSQPVTIHNAWIENAGKVRCYPPMPEEHQNLSEASPPPHDRAILEAKIREPFGRADCASPFQNVRVTNVVEPDYRPVNATFAGTAIIEVLVTPDARVADATILQSSGTPAFDTAALDAARKSAYSAGIAYCLPTFARYTYKASVRP